MHNMLHCVQGIVIVTSDTNNFDVDWYLLKL